MLRLQGIQQVFGAKQLQLGDDGVEFIHPVVRQRFGLELGGARQRPTVDFHHLLVGHGVAGGVEVCRHNGDNLAI